MSVPVLDYSTSISDRNSDFEREPFLRLPCWHIVNLFKSVYGRRQCPHCEDQVEITSIQGFTDVSANRRREILERQLSIRLYGCTGCGWWSENVEYFDPKRGGAPFVCEVGTLAVLRQFKREDRELPLFALTLELRKRPKILYDLHSQKFEQLVGAVISEFTKVEAKIVGRSGDRVWI